MGMIAVFRRLGDADLSLLLEEPELIDDYLEEEQLEGFGPFADFDADKSWHAIHFLLTGTAWGGEPPLNFIAVGGTAIGEDLGYGPARGLTSAEVRRLAKALEALPPDSLMRRFDAASLTAAKIYPEIWDRPAEEDDTRGYVAENYEGLRAFIVDASVAGEALLISIR